MTDSTMNRILSADEICRRHEAKWGRDADLYRGELIKDLDGALWAHQKRMEAIHRDAIDRSLTASEQRQWDAHEKAREALQDALDDQARKDVAEAERKRARVNESRARWGTTEVMNHVDPWGTPTAPAEFYAAATDRAATQVRSQAFAAIEQTASVMPDTAVEHVTRNLQADEDPQAGLSRFIVEASQPAYASAFAKWFRDPVRGHLEWEPAEREAYSRVQTLVRAMSLSGASGGYLVPYQLDPQILISGAGSVDPMRKVARNVITAYNEWRGVTSAGVSASWDAEAAEVSDDTPTLAQPTITCAKGQAFVPVSFELWEDSNILAQLGGLMADSKAQLEATAFTLGSGSGQPKGVVTAIAAVGGSVVTSAGSSLALADIVANQNALPARWRANAKFMANLTMINAARQLPMYTNGPSVVNDSTTPPTALGWQLLENSVMDGTIAAGTTNDYVWLSGDFNQYAVVDRVGTTVEVVPHLFGSNQRPTGQRGVLMHFRTGGDALITDAFRLTNYSA